MRISDWSSDVCSSDLMLAKPRAARRNLVLGVRELTAQAHRLVFGRAHPAERQVHAAECGLALDETEGLRNGEFEGEPKQFVEHAGARLARIILYRTEADIDRQGGGKGTNVAGG